MIIYSLQMEKIGYDTATIGLFDSEEKARAFLKKDRGGYTLDERKFKIVPQQLNETYFEYWD